MLFWGGILLVLVLVYEYKYLCVYVKMCNKYLLTFIVMLPLLIVHFLSNKKVFYYYLYSSI